MAIKLQFVVLEWVPSIDSWKYKEKLSYITDDKKKATLRINKIKKILLKKEI